MLIIHHIDGAVVDIISARRDVTADALAVVDSIPTFEQREGYNGVLRYAEDVGLYWEYVEAPVSTEPTIEEKAAAYDILMGEAE